MNKARITMFFVAMVAMMGVIWRPAVAQSTTSASQPTAQQASQPDQSSASETKTFKGRIVKSGDKLVLSDPESKSTYQLDDQEKAREYVNQNVKVTGVLDASTGMIRVSAIEPA